MYCAKCGSTRIGGTLKCHPGLNTAIGLGSSLLALVLGQSIGANGMWMHDVRIHRYCQDCKSTDIRVPRLKVVKYGPPTADGSKPEWVKLENGGSAYSNRPDGSGCCSCMILLVITVLVLLICAYFFLGGGPKLNTADGTIT